jgi:DNA-binding GntR family transcriptional regulator
LAAERIDQVLQVRTDLEQAAVRDLTLRIDLAPVADLTSQIDQVQAVPEARGPGSTIGQVLLAALDRAVDVHRQAS